MFPINDIGETPIFLTSDFLKKELDFYKSTGDKEVFRQTIGNLDTFAFTITNMSAAIERAYEIARSDKNDKEYMRNYRAALTAYHEINKKVPPKAPSKAKVLANIGKIAAKEKAKKAAKKIREISPIKKKEDQTKTLGIVGLLAAGAAYLYINR